jgi:hypothetical protein
MEANTSLRRTTKDGARQATISSAAHLAVYPPAERTFSTASTLELSGGEAVRLERVVSLRTRNRYALNGS